MSDVIASPDGFPQPAKDTTTVVDEPIDLTVVIVSFNDGDWLERCLQAAFGRAGAIRVDVVIVDNGADGAHTLVRRPFAGVRVLQTENRGFANGNNVALMSGTARHVLFLNPDTELVEGSLADLLAALDDRPEVGLIGVRQVTAEGTLWPTIRYFLNVGRELNRVLYARETECDWTSGSFMLARREALLSAGLFDERFVLYSEEPDRCLRIKRADWSVRHLPEMTIVHHAGKGGTRPTMTEQDAFTRRQYAQKHFGTPHRIAYLAAVGVGHLLRAVFYGRGRSPEGRRAARLALRTLCGRADAPFGPPPPIAFPRSRRRAG